MPRIITTFFFYLSLSFTVFSQANYSLFYDSVTGKYEVYLYPTSSIGTSGLASTGQVTIVFPTGTYPWSGNLASDVMVVNSLGVWTANTLVEQPCSSVGYDYLSIGLTSIFSTSNITAGTPVLLFELMFPGGCSGELALIENDIDPYDVSPDNICSGSPTSPGNSFILVTNNASSLTYSEEYEGNFNIGNTDCNETSTLEPLPLELLNFTGQLVSDFEVLLQWETTNEEGVQHFIVEHSDDGRTFSSIGIRNAIGNGLSGNFDYSLTHKKPVRGINYYRLKSIDLNGDFSFSQVIEITIKNELDEMVMFPNPTTGKVTLQLPDFIGFTDEANLSIQLYDVIHHLVKEQTIEAISNQLVEFDMGGLIPGSYILRVTHGSNAFNKLIILEEI